MDYTGFLKISPPCIFKNIFKPLPFSSSTSQLISFYLWYNFALILCFSPFLFPPPFFWAAGWWGCLFCFLRRIYFLKKQLSLLSCLLKSFHHSDFFWLPFLCNFLSLLFSFSWDFCQDFFAFPWRKKNMLLLILSVMVVFCFASW